jgi:hypothetical protein
MERKPETRCEAHVPANPRRDAQAKQEARR